jgi:diguanylate cyclase (GGDEF)-like protein
MMSVREDFDRPWRVGHVLGPRRRLTAALLVGVVVGALGQTVIAASGAVVPSWIGRSAAIASGALLIAVAWMLWSQHQRVLERDARYRARLEQEIFDRTRELAERNLELERVNQKLLDVSLSDPLTGLGNRRALLETMPGLIADLGAARYSARTEPGGLVLMLIDLDRLKPVNDQYGHEAGDRMLAQVATVLCECLRATDRVVRWGGDEFVVVSSPGDLDGGAALAERIRARIGTHQFRISAARHVRTTCSIGFACYPFLPDAPELITWEESLNLADRALYRAKSRRDAWIGWCGKPGAGQDAGLLMRVALDPRAAERSGELSIRCSDAGLFQAGELADLG